MVRSFDAYEFEIFINSNLSLVHNTLNHVTVGTGSPTISMVQNTFSPSVDENLSEGLMNFGSFPLATIGVDVFSQSWSKDSNYQIIFFRR